MGYAVLAQESQIQRDQYLCQETMTCVELEVKISTQPPWTPCASESKGEGAFVRSGVTDPNSQAGKVGPPSS